MHAVARHPAPVRDHHRDATLGPSRLHLRRRRLRGRYRQSFRKLPRPSRRRRTTPTPRHARPRRQPCQSKARRSKAGVRRRLKNLGLPATIVPTGEASRRPNLYNPEDSWIKCAGKTVLYIVLSPAIALYIVYDSSGDIYRATVKGVNNLAAATSGSPNSSSISSTAASARLRRASPRSPITPGRALARLATLPTPPSAPSRTAFVATPSFLRGRACVPSPTLRSAPSSRLPAASATMPSFRSGVAYARLPILLTAPSVTTRSFRRGGRRASSRPSSGAKSATRRMAPRGTSSLRSGMACASSPTSHGASCARRRVASAATFSFPSGRP